ncbi:hypothetical protein ROZALSC1DRAFT_30992 [Rozella allomycis CSF55]|uniref:C2 domain-containing protein n=1 Tax=Rozella allomycis (strain CSF55) TaxID=988480 RepID=A0A4P9YD04_ROZAC|nr:hypothetical protein ROZALSC1DRAFT_30992 [Rozella allomycis CSF55]
MEYGLKSPEIMAKIRDFLMRRINLELMEAQTELPIAVEDMEVVDFDFGTETPVIGVCDFEMPIGIESDRMNQWIFYSCKVDIDDRKKDCGLFSKDGKVSGQVEFFTMLKPFLSIMTSDVPNFVLDVRYGNVPFPKLSNLVHFKVTQVMSSLFVYPNSRRYMIDKDSDLLPDALSPVRSGFEYCFLPGSLMMRIGRVKNLCVTEPIHSYVNVDVMGNKYRSNIVYSSRQPFFNEVSFFNVYQVAAYEPDIHVSLIHRKKRIAIDEVVGSATFTLRHIVYDQLKKINLKLYDKDHREIGNLQLEFLLFSHAYESAELELEHHKKQQQQLIPSKINFNNSSETFNETDYLCSMIRDDIQKIHNLFHNVPRGHRPENEISLSEYFEFGFACRMLENELSDLISCTRSLHICTFKSLPFMIQQISSLEMRIRTILEHLGKAASNFLTGAAIGRARDWEFVIAELQEKISNLMHVVYLMWNNSKSFYNLDNESRETTATTLMDSHSIKESSYSSVTLNSVDSYLKIDAPVTEEMKAENDITFSCKIFNIRGLVSCTKTHLEFHFHQESIPSNVLEGIFYQMNQTWEPNQEPTRVALDQKFTKYYKFQLDHQRLIVRKKNDSVYFIKQVFGISDIRKIEIHQPCDNKALSKAVFSIHLDDGYFVRYGIDPNMAEILFERIQSFLFFDLWVGKSEHSKFSLPLVNITDVSLESQPVCGTDKDLFHEEKNYSFISLKIKHPYRDDDVFGSLNLSALVGNISLFELKNFILNRIEMANDDPNAHHSTKSINSFQPSQISLLWSPLTTVIHVPFGKYNREYLARVQLVNQSCIPSFFKKSEMYTLFKVITTRQVQTYPCSFKGIVNGTLYICDTHVAFLGKAFTKHVKILIPISHIKSVQGNMTMLLKNLTISMYNNEELVFMKFKNHTGSLCRDELNRLIMKRNRKMSIATSQ